jgi:hypothetical protein
MEIRHDAVSKILDFNFHKADKVSLFVYSNKSSKLKRLDLAELSPEKRVEKLKNWGKDNRFVAVVERGDAVFAFTSARNAEQLAGQSDLSIDGKKVSVKKLSDSEYERLSEVGQEIEKFLELNPKEKLQDHEDEKTQNKLSEAYLQRQSLNKKSDKSSYSAIDTMIMKMANIPEKIKFSILSRMNEDYRIEEKRSREEALKKEQKQEEIKGRIIQKEVINKEIDKKSIDKKEKAEDEQNF